MRKTVLLILTLFIIGCSYLPQRQQQRYYRIISNPSILLIDETDMPQVAIARGLYRDTKGFYDPETNIMYVPYERDFTLPDFCVFGHEVWHLKELGGNFHESEGK